MTSTVSLTLSPTRRREFPIEATIAAAKRGDPKAFATLYDTHVGRVYAICLRMAGDPVRAGELVQDVFVRVWERLGSFRGESAFATWLHRLTVNVVLAGHRADRRRRGRVILGEDLAPGGADGPTPKSHPGLLIDLEHAVATLPRLLREVFVLHDVEGVPHGEIAELLSIPVGTCRSHLFQARRRLREVLQ